MENSSEIKEKAFHLKLKGDQKDKRFNNVLNKKTPKVIETTETFERMKKDNKSNNYSIPQVPKNSNIETKMQKEAHNCMQSQISNEKWHLYSTNSPKNIKYMKTSKDKSQKFNINIPKSEFRHFPFSASSKKIDNQMVEYKINKMYNVFNMFNIFDLNSSSEFMDTIFLENQNIYEIQFESYIKSKLLIRTMNFRKNLISQIPRNIDVFVNLIEIRMDLNKLTSIPTSIGNLKCLSILTLSCNLINQLPIEIKNLKNLSILSLHDNLFIEFPLVITELDLKELYFHNNNISYLPYDFCKLVHLKEFSFDWILFIEPSKLLSEKSRSNNLSNLRNYLSYLKSQSLLKLKLEFQKGSKNTKSKNTFFSAVKCQKNLTSINKIIEQNLHSEALSKFNGNPLSRNLNLITKQYNSKQEAKEKRKEINEKSLNSYEFSHISERCSFCEFLSYFCCIGNDKKLVLDLGKSPEILNIDEIKSNVEKLSKLKCQPFAPNIELFGGRNALHFASINGCYNEAKALIQCGIDINLPDNNDEAPLWLSLISENYKIASLIIKNKNCNPNIKSLKYGFPLLFLLKKKDYELAIQIILNSNSKLNVVDEEGNNALHIIFSQYNNSDPVVLKTLQLLCNEDLISIPSKNQLNFNKMSPLHLAVKNNQKSAIHFALNKSKAKFKLNDKVYDTDYVNGFNINLRGGKADWTILHFAVIYSDIEIVKLIIDSGSKNLKDSNGKTAFDLSILNSPTFFFLRSFQKKTCKLIFKERLKYIKAETSLSNFGIEKRIHLSNCTHHAQYEKGEIESTKNIKNIKAKCQLESSNINEENNIDDRSVRNRMEQYSKIIPFPKKLNSIDFTKADKKFISEEKESSDSNISDILNEFSDYSEFSHISEIDKMEEKYRSSDINNNKKKSNHKFSCDDPVPKILTPTSKRIKGFPKCQAHYENKSLIKLELQTISSTTKDKNTPQELKISTKNKVSQSIIYQNILPLISNSDSHFCDFLFHQIDTRIFPRDKVIKLNKIQVYHHFPKNRNDTINNIYLNKESSLNKSKQLILEFPSLPIYLQIRSIYLSYNLYNFINFLDLNRKDLNFQKIIEFELIYLIGIEELLDVNVLFEFLHENSSKYLIFEILNAQERMKNQTNNRFIFRKESSRNISTNYKERTMEQKLKSSYSLIYTNCPFENNLESNVFLSKETI